MSATQQPLGEIGPDRVGARDDAGGEVTTDVVARAGRRELWVGVAVVGALTALFAAVNWHWLSVNVVTYGWDRLDHLITSLVYNNMFLAPRLATVYEVLAYSNYYPPLVHLGVVALYKLFGVDQDVAAMVNVGYMAVLLASTWAIGRRLAGANSGILAAILLGAVPMIYAMSRYLYLDFALTAMVAASVATLLAADRFRRRRWSLLFGVAIGLAFLVKWTTAAFLIGPLVFIVWRSGIVPFAIRHPRSLLPDWRHLLVALAASAALNALWLVPARGAVAVNPLGWWLLPLFTVLLTGALYALFAARRHGENGAQALNNALSGAAIGAWILSLWYLTNAEFAQGFMHTAYGREGGRFWAYDKYLEEVTFEQLGLFYAALFVLVAVVWLAQQRGRLRRSLAGLSDTAWVLVLWAGISYVIFSSRVSLAHSRFLMPFLPPFAIWIAAGLLQWRPPWLRRLAIALVIAVASAQFLLISFETFAPWRTALAVTAGDTVIDPVAHGFFIQYPASGVTDPGYAIESQVLDVVEQARQEQGRDTLELGLLVNSYQLHEKQFLYQIYVKYPAVRLRELARNWSDRPAYNQLFEMDYVLIGDSHSYRTNEASQAIADRILADDRDLFNLAFRPVHTWTFPNDEQLTLFARRFASTEPGMAVDDYRLLFEGLAGLLGRGDALVLTAPDQAYMAGLVLGDQHDFSVVPLPAEGGAAAQVDAALAELAQDHDRSFLVRHNPEQADPGGAIEGWLRGNLVAGSDIWANSLRVTPFIAADAGDGPLESMDAKWIDGPRLEAAALTTAGDDDSLHPGGALAATLIWSVAAEPAAALKASLQLFAPDGALVSQNDQELHAGAQQYVLLLPQELPPGEYTLAAIVYDPATGQRLTVEGGGEQAVVAAVAAE